MHVDFGHVRLSHAGIWWTHEATRWPGSILLYLSPSLLCTQLARGYLYDNSPGSPTGADDLQLPKPGPHITFLSPFVGP